MLKLSGISKSFTARSGESVEAVRNINLEIKEGEFVAIVGPSGCGKTTLLNIMAGLIPPSQGIISIDGNELRGTSEKLGFVFQKTALFPWLTVGENIAFGLTLHGVSPEKKMEAVKKYLSVTGLAQYENSFPNQLSGGMQQRAAIARTLANDPRIVLLDEPFGALDVQTRSQMQEFLVRLWEEERKTMVMVTHDIQEALYTATRVVVLGTKPGTIKEIIDVPLARPRRPAIRLQPEFERLERYIEYTIRAESIKATIDAGEASKNKSPIRIGMHAWPGVAPFYLAKERGIFLKQNISVDLVGFETSNDRMQAWRDDKADLYNTTLDGAVLLQKQFPETRVLCAMDKSAGGDALIVKENIKNIKDLHGKKIGLERDYVVGEFFLAYLLDQVGLSLKDVKVVNIKASEVGSAIIAKKIDAGIIWEPWLTKAIELSGAKILASSLDGPSLYSILVVKKKTWDEKKDELSKIPLVWRETIKLYDQNPGAAIKTMAPYFGVAELELAEHFDKLKFVSSPVSLEESLHQIEKIFLKEGLITEKTPEDFILKIS